MTVKIGLGRLSVINFDLSDLVYMDSVFIRLQLKEQKEWGKTTEAVKEPEFCRFIH